MIFEACFVYLSNKKSTTMTKNIQLIFAILLFALMNSGAQNTSVMIPAYNNETANKFASQALTFLETEYPFTINYIASEDRKINSVNDLHPAFNGCFNWHSSIKTHWLTIKLLNDFENLPNKEQLIALIDKNIDPKHIQVEIENFNNHIYPPEIKPYSWAWILKLTSELAQSKTEQEKKWFEALLPLAETVKKEYYDYLPALYYPVRKGGRSNTALAIAFALDYAIALNDKTFEEFLKERAKFYYLNDRNIPASWEPEGEDLVSPALIEAELMRRVLNKNDFVRWFKSFLPEIPFTLAHPAVVTNRNHTNSVSLDGLNLSRAWCMFELAKAMPDDSQIHRDLWQAGYRHAAEALNNVLAINKTETSNYTAYALLMYLSIADIQQ
jgi:hypothetical protein